MIPKVLVSKFPGTSRTLLPYTTGLLLGLSTASFFRPTPPASRYQPTHALRNVRYCYGVDRAREWGESRVIERYVWPGSYQEPRPYGLTIYPVGAVHNRTYD
eukprot:1669745-Rhodomonas_salina.1